MKVYRRRHVIADLNAAAASNASTPDWWCADRRLQRNVIRPVERGHLRDGNIGPDPDVRITLGRRAPRKAGQAPALPTSPAVNHAQEPDAAQRRAPNHAPSRPRIATGVGRSTKHTGAARSRPPRISSLRGLASGVRATPEYPKRKTSWRRPYNVRAEPRR
jgi:hypothetical protein